MAEETRAPSRDFCLVFTDGACSSNGSVDAAAGYGIAFLGPAIGPGEPHRIWGRVPAQEFALADPSDPGAGFAPTDVAATPTNNRGEYLAACWGLLGLLRQARRRRQEGAAPAQYELVSDSNLFIRTITEWLPTRRRKGTERDLKNFDLIVVAEALSNALTAEGCPVKFTHERGHQKAPPESAEPRKKILHMGNDQADRLAVMGKHTEGHHAE